MKKVTVEELLKPYEPKDPVDALYDGIKARRDFERTRGKAKNFKPMPVADCHIARNCGNCWYNKGRIDELSEFVEYGFSFYYGFYVCTVDGREAERCKVTTNDSVCSRHKFKEVEGSFKIRPRDKVLSLRHLERCIAQRVEKEWREAEAAKVPCGTNGVEGGGEA